MSDVHRLVSLRGRGGSTATGSITRHRRGQSGTALVEMVWLGLVLLIPLVYLLMTFVAVQRSAYGATEAARAAGRAFVLAPNVQAARQRAFDAAVVAMADQGVHLMHSQLQIVCHPQPTSCLQPGSTVQVDVRLGVVLPLLPDVFGRHPASIAVHASHVEPYGVYREAG